MKKITTALGVFRYVCPVCHESHAFEAEAEACCAKPRYQCSECGMGHETARDELLCCNPVMGTGEPGNRQVGGIEATLAERGNRYGSFPEHARITQNLKRAMADSPNWPTLPDDMKESLEMVAHKVGRILNGDPAYHDSWHDITGYATLVADRLAVEGDE